MRWALILSLLIPSVGAAQRLRGERMPGCDPYGYPAGLCGRHPDGCGGVVDLGPCDHLEVARTVVRDVGVWSLGGPVDPTPAFASPLGPAGGSASWMYVFSNRPLAPLRVQVRYPGGRPAWGFPATTRALRWEGVGHPPPGGGAWTSLAAAVAVPVGGPWSHAGVMMHGGTVRVRSPITMRDQGFVSARGEHTLFIITREAFQEMRVFGRQSALIEVGDHARLRLRLQEELVQRGLTAAEASALIAARVEPLIGAQPAPVLYFLPREAIDRAQPLTIRPAPDLLMRVRLVADYR